MWWETALFCLQLFPPVLLCSAWEKTKVMQRPNGSLRTMCFPVQKDILPPPEATMISLNKDGGKGPIMTSLKKGEGGHYDISDKGEWDHYDWKGGVWSFFQWCQVPQLRAWKTGQRSYPDPTWHHPPASQRDNALRERLNVPHSTHSATVTACTHSATVKELHSNRYRENKITAIKKAKYSQKKME